MQRTSPQEWETESCGISIPTLLVEDLFPIIVVPGNMYTKNAVELLALVGARVARVKDAPTDVPLVGIISVVIQCGEPCSSILARRNFSPDIATSLGLPSFPVEHPHFCSKVII